MRAVPLTSGPEFLGCNRARLPLAGGSDSCLASLAGRAQRWRARLLGVEPPITDEAVLICGHEWACISRRAEERLAYRITPSREGLEATLAALERGAG